VANQDVIRLTSKTFTASESLAAYSVARIYDDSALVLDGSATAHVDKPRGVTLNSASIGEPVEVQVVGIIENEAWTFIEGLVYAGTAGVLTQSVSGLASTHPIGYAVSPTSLILINSTTIPTISNVDSLQFSGGTGTQGLMSWNPDEETVDLVTNGAVLQLGQELHIHGRNSTGFDIPDGTPVMAVGTLGASGRILVAKMDGSTSASAKYIVGITTETIEAGTDGKITTFGKIRGIDTTGTPYGEVWAEGDVIWVDPTTIGGLTKTRPLTGVAMPLAIVVSVHANIGTLMVRITPIDENAYEPIDINILRSTNFGKVEIDALGVVAAGLNLGNAAYVNCDFTSGATRMLGINSSNVAYVGPIDSPTTTVIAKGKWNFQEGDTQVSGALDVINDITIGKYATTDTGSLFLTGSTADRKARLHCTNGNLHIDAHDGYATYLNYFTGNGTLLYADTIAVAQFYATIIRLSQNTEVAGKLTINNTTASTLEWLFGTNGKHTITKDGHYLRLKADDGTLIQEWRNSTLGNKEVWTYATAQFTANMYVGGNSSVIGDITLVSGNLIRGQHHTGHLEGSYNNVGANILKSNPIYTIGSSYNPSDAALGNMYGIGYCHSTATFINSTDTGVGTDQGFGLYIASEGKARIFLDATLGRIYCKNDIYEAGTKLSDKYKSKSKSDGMTTGNTSSTSAGKYTKIAAITIDTQYGDKNITLAATSVGHGGHTAYAHLLSIRVKQQAAFGNDPLIEITASYMRYYNVLYAYKIVQNTPETIVEIYVKITSSYTVLSYDKIAEAGGEVLDLFSGQPFVSSVAGAVNVITTDVYEAAVKLSDKYAPIGGSEIAIMEDQKTSGTRGGTSIVGSQVRSHNVTTVAQSWLTNNTTSFILTAGTYEIEASSPAYDISGHNIYLENDTDSTNVAFGTSAVCKAVTGNTRSEIDAIITITGTKTFKLWHKTAQVHSYGLGESGGGISHEIYTRIKITKLG